LKEKWERTQSFDAAGTNATDATEAAIRGKFERRLCVQDLRQIAMNLSRGLSVASPGKTAKRAKLIGWFHRNWNIVEGPVSEMVKNEVHVEAVSLTTGNR
jgi:hypothetical protein